VKNQERGKRKDRFKNALDGENPSIFEKNKEKAHCIAYVSDTVPVSEAVICSWMEESRGSCGHCSPRSRNAEARLWREWTALSLACQEITSGSTLACSSAEW